MADGPVKVKESERVLDEKVTRKTEEYLDENGQQKVRTVEIVEKIIEKEVFPISDSLFTYTYTAWPRRRTPSFFFLLHLHLSFSLFGFLFGLLARRILFVLDRTRMHACSFPSEIRDAPPNLATA